MKASIIIPTLNRAEQLSRTLNTLVTLDFNNSSYELIVVDNGSTDKSKEVVLSLRDRNPAHTIRYIYDDVPGLLTGRHRGANEAKSELLVFVDDDILADKGWLTAIVNSFEKNAEIQLLGGKCLPAFSKEPPAWLSYFWKELPDGGRMLTDLSLCDYGDKEIQIHPTWVWGLNFSIRKEAFIKCGGFHPDNISAPYQYLQGDGETGLSFKLLKAGYKAFYNPNALVYHEVPVERMTYSYFEKRYFYQGVCNSYTQIRRTGGSRIKNYFTTLGKKVKGYLGRSYRQILYSRTEPLPVNFEEHMLKTRFKAMERAGFAFHQKLVWSNPELMKWVLKKNYFDYKLPLI